MKVKKIICLVIIILLIGLVHSCKGVETQYGELNFNYNQKDYNINVKELAKKYGQDIEDYPYYFVGIEYPTNAIIICYSSTRISICSMNGICNEISKSGIALYTKLNANGTTNELYNWGNFNIAIIGHIASNQNIYSGKNKVYTRNQGYEYDATNEKDKACNDIVKTTKNTVVYDGAAINYDQIIIFSPEVVLKRINKEVNDVNGHLWDKVLLRDGTVGYVFSDNLEITEDYTNVQFKYDNKNYNIYFSPTNYKKNMTDYPYYVVGKEYATSDILIGYSSTRISIGNMNIVCNEIPKSEKGFLIKVKTNRFNSNC